MSESITKYDLSMKIGQYLDSHSVLPLLEFLSTQRLYNEKYLLAAKLDILDKTHMIDYSADIYQMYHGVTTTPQIYIDRRTKILENLKGLRTKAEPIIELVDQVQEKSTTSMRDSKSVLNYLEKETNFKMEMLEDLIKYAKGLYESGNYAIASSYLYFCTLVMSPNDKNFLSVLWGKLAASTLLQDWEAALEDSTRLKDYIDGTNNTSPVFILQQRTWLIHWSLFIFFNHPKGWDLIIDMFLYRPHYLNAIQTTCPHILRYLTAAVIVNRQRRTALKDLIKVIQQESYSYRDPITEFIEQLYIKFDFEAARQKLQECQTVVNTDFFLVNLLGEFVESARLLIFENFCRIHQCITISMLAEKLNMTADSAECWIVNLIRTARLNAKIDSKLGHVIMMGQQDLASPYQQLIEKIENLNAKSEILENLIQTKVKAKVTDSSNIVWN